MCTRRSVKCVVVRIFSIVTRKMEKENEHKCIYLSIHHQQEQQQHHHHPPSFERNATTQYTPMLYITFSIAYTTLTLCNTVPLAHNIPYTMWKVDMTMMETVNVFSAPGVIEPPSFHFQFGFLSTCARITLCFASVHCMLQFIFHPCRNSGWFALVNVQRKTFKMIPI